MQKVCEYNEELHQYFVGGEEKPSVTEIANPISFERISSLQVSLLERARARGSRCHELFEQYLLFGELDPEEIEAEYFPYVQQFVLWAKTYRPKVLFTEKKLFSEEFCGTADLICEIDGKLIIVDYKVTSAIDKKSLSVQLEGYYRLCKKLGLEIDECYFLHIKKDSYVFKPIKRDAEWFDMLLFHNKKMRGKYDGK
jgi:hypothetical protein